MKAYLAKGLVFLDRDCALIYARCVDSVKTINIDSKDQGFDCKIDIDRDDNKIQLMLWAEPEHNYPVDFYALDPYKAGVETTQNPEGFEREFLDWDSTVPISSFSSKLQVLISEQADEYIHEVNR